MRKWQLKHLNKHIRQKNKRNGQSLVEFALISILLFTLIFGILEMGRLIYIFVQMSSAVQEGVRYGSTHPSEITSGGGYPASSVNADPCNIIAQAKEKIVGLDTNTSSPTSTLKIEVGYDDGSDNVRYPFASGSPSFNVFDDRVVVTATYQFNFLVPLFDRFLPNGLPVRVVSARTIVGQPSTGQPNDTSCTYTP